MSIFANSNKILISRIADQKWMKTLLKKRMKKLRRMRATIIIIIRKKLQSRNK